MRARDFLLEYDAELTSKNFAEQLYSRAYGYAPDAEDRNFNWEDKRGQQLLGLDNYTRDHWRGGDRILQWFQDNDPTGGKFVLTMVRWYLTNDMRYLEDAPKLKGPIATYVKFRNRIKGINLKTISMDDFMSAMEAQQGTLSNAEADKAQEQGYYDRKEAILVHDDVHLKIVLLGTMAASCFFGRNTRWCTTSRDKNENMFNAYAKDGPLFVILDKTNNARWQFHFDLGQSVTLRMTEHQFMDEKDHPVNPLLVMGGEPLEEITNWSHNIDGLYDAIQNAVVDNFRDAEEDGKWSEEDGDQVLGMYGIGRGDIWS